MVRRRQRQRSAAIGIVIVVVLALVAGLLTVLALQSVEPKPTGRSAEPGPTFSFGHPDATATPSAEAEPAALGNPPRAEQRMLAVGSEPDVMWRAIEGSCTEGIPPLIERSADRGATWTDVTPVYRDVRQVLAIEPFAGNQAQAVLVSGDDCVVEGLRTFTQGRFWEPYDDVLAQATYAAPSQLSIVVALGGEITTPCEGPRDVRAAAGTISLICGGDLHRRVDGFWVAAGYTGVAAHAIDNNGIPTMVAWRSASCHGLMLSVPSSSGLSAGECAVDIESNAGVALASGRNGAWIWHGDAVTSLQIGG